LHLIRPLLGFLPEVLSVDRKIPFREKLGITPIVTSGMVMQLLVGSKIIEVDNIVREDRALLNGAQKLLGILIAIGEAVAYALSGMYDNVNQLGTGNAILIILQLFLVIHSVPVGGLAYYVTAPSSLADVLAYIQALFYVVFMLSACALFSKPWTEVSASSAKDVAKQLKEQPIVVTVLTLSGSMEITL
jgi:preprotein translocase subunit SecY